MLAGISERYCYVLVGYDGDDFGSAEFRCRTAMSAGFLPFAMLYRDPDGHVNGNWRAFQREWCRMGETKQFTRVPPSDRAGWLPWLRGYTCYACGGWSEGYVRCSECGDEACPECGSCSYFGRAAFDTILMYYSEYTELQEIADSGVWDDQLPADRPGRKYQDHTNNSHCEASP